MELDDQRRRLGAQSVRYAQMLTLAAHWNRLECPTCKDTRKRRIQTRAMTSGWPMECCWCEWSRECLMQYRRQRCFQVEPTTSEDGGCSLGVKRRTTQRAGGRKAGPTKRGTTTQGKEMKGGSSSSTQQQDVEKTTPHKKREDERSATQ